MVFRRIVGSQLLYRLNGARRRGLLDSVGHVAGPLHQPVRAAQREIEDLTVLPGGYHRDVQHTKAPLLRGVRTGLETLRVASLLVRGLNGFAWPATRMAMARRRLSAEERRGYLFPYGSWADRVAVDAFVRDIPMNREHPTRATLEAVEAGLARLREKQALIIWGGRDFCFNDHFLGRWRTILPGAAVHRIADAGHYVIDDAREEAVPLIRSFLERA